MAKEISAGLIAYYFDNETKQFKFLLAHPGGPYFKNVKKFGFPKGQVEEGEDLKETAIREFKEETGIKHIDYRKLKIRLERIGSKKNVYYYLYPMEEIWDLKDLYSNTFYSDKFQMEIPENDYYLYVPLEELKDYLFKQDLVLIKDIEDNFEKHF